MLWSKILLENPNKLDKRESGNCNRVGLFAGIIIMDVSDESSEVSIELYAFFMW